MRDNGIVSHSTTFCQLSSQIRKCHGNSQETSHGYYCQGREISVAGILYFDEYRSTREHADSRAPRCKFGHSELQTQKLNYVWILNAYL